MVRFQIVYCLASDGKAQVNGIDNTPTKEQQQQSEKKWGEKTVVDYYRALSKTDGKYVDWRQKLACMAIREQLPQAWDEVSQDPNRSYLLYDFPIGFTLWEHVKKTIDADGKITKTKSHAAGGHDRMDAYLYGHPSKKRFRSPGEFFPHLLWLMTDETLDYENCRCVCCCPDNLQTAEVRAATAKSEGSAKVKQHDVQSAKKAPTYHTEASARPGKNPYTPSAPQQAAATPNQPAPTDPKLSTSMGSQTMLLNSGSMAPVQHSPQTPVPPTQNSAGAASAENAQHRTVAQRYPNPNFQNIYNQPLPGSQQSDQFQNQGQQQNPYDMQSPEMQAQGLSNRGMHGQGIHNQHGMPRQSIPGQMGPQLSYSSAPSFQHYQNANQLAYAQQQQDFPMHATEQQYGNFNMPLGSEEYTAHGGQSQAFMDEINQFIDMNGGEYPQFGS